MKTIEMKTFCEQFGNRWDDGKGNAVSVSRDDETHDGFSVLHIDGVRHLIANVEPRVNLNDGGIWVFYRCFEPTPGVKYRAVFDGQDVGGGLAAIIHNRQWYDVTESCQVDDIIVAGADMESHSATA